MRVLILESDRENARLLATTLSAEGYNPYVTDTSEEGVDLARIYDYDLVLTETVLPDGSGVEAVRLMRDSKVKAPVMFVTADATIETKRRAFTAGADDYLVKPYHRDELVARSQALIRRSKGHAAAIIRVGPIALNLDTRSISVNDKPIHLTGKEYRVIELLALRLGQTITKEMLLDHLYGGMDEPEIKIIDVFVCKVRAKLRKAGAAGHIRTIWGSGYQMTEEPGQELQTKPPAGGVSLPARVLAAVAAIPANQTRSTREVARAMGVDDDSTFRVLRALQTLRRHGWVSRLGSRHTGAWAITAAGLAEQNRRAALPAAA